jgi:hypothetical protein
MTTTTNITTNNCFLLSMEVVVLSRPIMEVNSRGTSFTAASAILAQSEEEEAEKKLYNTHMDVVISVFF